MFFLCHCVCILERIHDNVTHVDNIHDSRPAAYKHTKHLLHGMKI